MAHARVSRLPHACFIAALACHWEVLGMHTVGTLPSDSVFNIYAGKFCFDHVRSQDEDAGEFYFRVQGKVVPGPRDDDDLAFTDGPPCYGPCETQGNLYIVVFDDESHHWEEAEKGWNELTCEEMLHYSNFAMPISPLDGWVNRTVYVHEKLRPRFWYFTFASCGAIIEEPLTYELHAVNVRMGIQREFGLDEEGSIQLQLAATILFLTISVCLRRTARRSTGTEALRSRPILRLLLVSAIFSTFGAACRTLHYTVFAYNGDGWSSMDVVGQLWICAAKAALTLLQLLTAKGWSLFYGRHESMQRRLILCVLGGIVLISAACEIHADYSLDWSTNLYLYESWTGTAILILNLFLFVEAWRSMCEAYRRESSEEVRVFYAMISAASLVYFTSLPLLCFLSAVFAPWVRLKYVNRTEVASRFIATTLLALCLRPSRLDSMVNARLEEGLDTVGELRDDSEDKDYDSSEHLNRALD